MKSVFQKIKIVLFIILSLLIGIFIYFMLGTYSTGSRAGTVVKLSQKGVVSKTWEGQLNMAMFISDVASSSATTNHWNFSVYSKDTTVINVLNKAMLSGHRVKLDYEERYFKFFWNGETKYFVTKVELEP